MNRALVQRESERTLTETAAEIAAREKEEVALAKRRLLELRYAPNVPAIFTQNPAFVTGALAVGVAALVRIPAARIAARMAAFWVFRAGVVHLARRYFS